MDISFEKGRLQRLSSTFRDFPGCVCLVAYIYRDQNRKINYTAYLEIKVLGYESLYIK